MPGTDSATRAMNGMVLEVSMHQSSVMASRFSLRPSTAIAAHSGAFAWR